MSLVAGRFRPLEQLGFGSMGIVTRAWDELLEREVALKELRAPDQIDADEALERFVGEARAAARLRHSSIVTVYDVLVDGDRLVIAMEMLDGQTVGDALTSGVPLPTETCRHIASGVADALAEAHSQQVVHRDLKPDNVFWLPSGRIVVVDFGLARIGAGRGTRAGTIMGTPGYMAPEQVRGDDVGPAADVFAWGALVYEALSGRPPFGPPDLDVATLLFRVVNEDPPPLHVPEDQPLADLVMAALDKDPGRRPPDGTSLSHLLRSGPTLATPPALQPATPTPADSRTSRSMSAGWIAAGTGAVLAVIVAAAILMSVLARDDPAPQVLGDMTIAAQDPTTTTLTSTTSSSPPTTQPVAPLTVADVVASSTAPDGIDSQNNPVSYDARNVIDGDPGTTWRTAGDGAGERLVLRLGAPAQIRRVGLIPGYAKVDPFDGTDRFTQSRRVTSVLWSFADGTSVRQDLDPNNRSIQWIDVDTGGDSVVLEILSVTPPGGRDFTAISEIGIHGT